MDYLKFCLVVILTVTPLYQNHLKIVTLLFESFFTLVANTRANERKKNTRRPKIHRWTAAK